MIDNFFYIEETYAYGEFITLPFNTKQEAIDYIKKEYNKKGYKLKKFIDKNKDLCFDVIERRNKNEWYPLNSATIKQRKDNEIISGGYCE